MTTFIKKIILSILLVFTSFSSSFGRYYDSQLSSWISTDPILHEYFLPPQGGVNFDKGYGGIYNPINLNLYNYTYHNPVVYIDPDGKIGIGAPILIISSPKVAFRPTLRPVPLTPISKPPSFTFRPGIWSRFSNWIRSKFRVSKPTGGFGRRYTKSGVKREPAINYWRKQLLKNRKDLSLENVKRIQKGRSPVVDKRWGKFHAKDRAFQGDKIELHHMKHGSKIKEMATTRHRGSGNYKQWHNTGK